MRIDLRLVPKGASEIKLPRDNLYMVQAMLYNLIEKSTTKRNQKLELFAFSWLKGHGGSRKSGQSIIFRPPLTFVITSPMRSVMEHLAGEDLGSKRLRLGQADLECRDVKVYEPEVMGNSIEIKTLSPVTVFSTEKREGKMDLINYYSPSDTEFSAKIDADLRNKYGVLFSGEIPSSDPVTITPLGEPRKQTARFRSKDLEAVTGWWGNFKLEGPQELLQLALDAGIGHKNSTGWGCLEFK